MIYIVRHGQTELNNKMVLQGRSNTHLNETGINQAKEAASQLSDIHFQKVYSSPLERAVETAKIIVPGAQILIDDRLIEMDYGPYEGMDLKDPAPEIKVFFSDFVHNPAPEGMEPLEKVVERTGVFLEECCRSEENILISTHAIAMKGLLEYLTPTSGGSYWSKYIGNCEIYITDYRESVFQTPKSMQEEGKLIYKN